MLADPVLNIYVSINILFVITGLSRLHHPFCSWLRAIGHGDQSPKQMAVYSTGEAPPGPPLSFAPQWANRTVGSERPCLSHTSKFSRFTQSEKPDEEYSIQTRTLGRAEDLPITGHVGPIEVDLNDAWRWLVVEHLASGMDGTKEIVVNSDPSLGCFPRLPETIPRTNINPTSSKHLLRLCLNQLPSIHPSFTRPRSVSPRDTSPAPRLVRRRQSPDRPPAAVFVSARWRFLNALVEPRNWSQSWVGQQENQMLACLG